MPVETRRRRRRRTQPTLRSELRRLALEMCAECGASGVAVGWKQTGGKVVTDRNKLCVAFFVPSKLPVAGQSKRLSDGRKRIPKEIVVVGQRFDTDVVAPKPNWAWKRQSGSAPTPSLEGSVRAGTAISDGTQFGTMGLFVRSEMAEGVFALTVKHLARNAGTNLYIPRPTQGAIVGRTSVALDSVPDTGFFGFDTDFTFVDVDAALVKIPSAQTSRLDNKIGKLGAPDGFVDSLAVTEEAYLSKLLNLRARTWSWRSGEKLGVVTHGFYTVASPKLNAKTFGLIVQGAGAIGQPSDSGKMWLTADSDGWSVLGLHKGIAMINDPTRAVLTDAGALARMWRLSVWSQ